MSDEYYGSFEPVGIDRQDLVEILVDILKEIDAPIDVDVYELQWRGKSLDYTGESLESQSIYTAFRMADKWDGIEFYFTWQSRSCSLILFNQFVGQTTVVFSEPSSLMDSQCKSANAARLLVDFLCIIALRIESGFCILEPGWTGRSRIWKDVEDWAEDVVGGTRRDWELVLLERSRLLPFRRQPSGYVVHDTQGLYRPISRIGGLKWPD